MRHILPAQPVTAASFGMLEAASSALLVAVAGNLGSPDLARDVRGFAVKLYTPEGNWDIVEKRTNASVRMPRRWKIAARVSSGIASSVSR